MFMMYSISNGNILNIYKAQLLRYQNITTTNKNQSIFFYSFSPRKRITHCTRFLLAVDCVPVSSLRLPGIEACDLRPLKPLDLQRRSLSAAAKASQSARERQKASKCLVIFFFQFVSTLFKSISLVLSS